MAIYHFSAKIISRSNGQNAVASAAYRSGEQLFDEQDGSEKFYSRSVAPETHILAPEKSPSWVYDRQALWNNVERSEKRINSQLAREFQIALPIELSDEQQTALVKEFIQTNCVDRGMIADIAIHRDHPENPHAHVMLTTREINRNGLGEKNRSWNSKEYLEHSRKAWAEMANKHLEQANSLERIDHRSYKDQGIELIPTEHLGVVGHRAMREGKPDRIADRNRRAAEYNKKIIDLQAKKEEMLQAGLTEKTADPSQLVITYQGYMGNQRELRIAINTVNYYENKLKNDKKLSLFEQEQLSEAKDQLKQLGKIKFDYLDNVKGFLNGKSSLYVKFANDFGNAQAEKLREKMITSGQKPEQISNDYLQRTAKRFSEEMTVRFANKIKQLNTSDFRTIVPAVERELYNTSAKRIIKGWVNHETVTKELNKLKEKFDKTRLNSSLRANKDTYRLAKNIGTLENVKQFYETQAVAELRSRGFHELVDKYDSPRYQSVVVSMYDELVRNGDKIKSPVNLETRVFNNFKLRKIQNLVRGELSGLNIERRRDSFEKWQGSLERSLNKLTNLEIGSLTPEELEKHQVRVAEKSEQLTQVKQNIQLLKEGQRILNARATEYLKENKELKKHLEDIQLSTRHKLHDPMSMEFKKAANYSLFDPDKELPRKEVLAKAYDNIMDFKEYEVEKNSKEVLYRHEYSSYRSIIGNLDESIRKSEELTVGMDKAKEVVRTYPETLKELEENMVRRNNYMQTTKVLRNDKKINEIDRWLDSKDITARTHSGALNQLKYQYNQAVYQVSKYQELTQAKIPALENMKIITENKAIRSVERDFKLEAGFSYGIKLSEAEKEVFVSYVETKKELGVEHLQTQKIEGKLESFVSKYKEAEKEVKSIAELITEQQTKLDRFERSINARLSKFEDSLYNQSPETITQAKKQVNDLREFKKNESKRMEQKVQELKRQEQEQRQKVAQHRNFVNVAGKLNKVVGSYKAQVSEAEMNLERSRRLRALQKDTGLELELERKNH